MKVWTMTRTAYYSSTGEVYLATSVHTTYRGALRAARAEIEDFASDYCEGASARELLSWYAAYRRNARRDGNWFDSRDFGHLVIAIERVDVGG